MTAAAADELEALLGAGALAQAVSRAQQASEPACDADVQLIASEARGAVETLAQWRAAAVDAERRRLLHRINNQLTGILSVAMLAKDDAGPALAAVLDDVIAAGQRAARLVKLLSTASG